MEFVGPPALRALLVDMTTKRLCLLLVSGILILELTGQTAGSNAYSVTEIFYHLTGTGQLGPVKWSIFRDGSKVLVEKQNTPEQVRKYHILLLYDLATHMEVFWDVDHAAYCNSAPFQDGEPALGDPFGSDVAVFRRSAKEVGAETIRGIATKIYQQTSPNRTLKMWIDPRSGAAMKVQEASNGEMLTTLEVLELSIGKPPAELFAVPAACAAGLKAAPTKPPAK